MKIIQAREYWFWYSLNDAIYIPDLPKKPSPPTSLMSSEEKTANEWNSHPLGSKQLGFERQFPRTPGQRFDIEPVPQLSDPKWPMDGDSPVGGIAELTPATWATRNRPTKSNGLATVFLLGYIAATASGRRDQLRWAKTLLEA